MPFVGAAAGDSSVQQLENVVVNLDESGAVVSAAENQYLRVSGAGDVKVEVPAKVSDVSVSKGAELRQSGDMLTFSTDVKGRDKPSDVYFDGKARVVDGDMGVISVPKGQKQLPATVGLDMKFNGQKVDDLKKIEGKRGEFEMTATVTNRTGAPEAVTYPDSVSGQTITRVAFTFMPLSVFFDELVYANGDWDQVEVENLGLQSKANMSFATGGAQLFPPTLPGSVTFRFRGLTRNFQLNSVRIVVMPGLHGEESELVTDAQTKGGGGTKILYDALGKILDGFEGAASQTEGLPFAAASLQRVIDEGLEKLKQSVMESAASLESRVVPKLDLFTEGLESVLTGEAGAVTNGAKVYNGLVSLNGSTAIGAVRGGLLALLSSIQTTLAPALGQIRDVVGFSNLPGPLCRTAVAPASCAAAYQLPELPNNTALATTSGQSVNVGPSPVGAPAVVTRSSAGTMGSDLRDTRLAAPGVYLGSIYNLAAFGKFSNATPTDADQSGTPDYNLYTYNDSLFPGGGAGVTAAKFGSQFLATTAIAQGDFYPGNSLGNTLKPPPNALFAAVCTLPGTACGDIPTSDVTISDLMTGASQAKFPTIMVAGVFPADLGDLFFRDSEKGILTPTYWNCMPTTVPDYPAGFRAGTACTGAPTDIPAPTYTNTVGLIPGSSGPDMMMECYPQLNRNLALLGQPPIPCAAALAPQFASMQALMGGIQATAFNRFWNFDNFLRGDPGFQLTDSGATSPRLSQVLNGIAMSLDVAQALCPSTLVTSPGVGVPRTPNPTLTTACSSVGMTNTTSTAVGGINALIAGVGNPAVPVYKADGSPGDIATGINALIAGMGNPATPSYDAAGLPANLNTLFAVLYAGVGQLLDGFGDFHRPEYDSAGDPATLTTVFVDVITGLGTTIPEAIGTDDASQAGITLEGSLAAIRDGLYNAAQQFADGSKQIPLLIGAVAGNQENADLNSAVSRAGIARAEAYKTFMGQARSGGSTADSSVIFTFQTPGTFEGSKPKV